MPSKYEKKAKQELESSGWIVDTKWGMNRWSRNNDYFHLFDLLAYKNGSLRWIAIKGHQGVPKMLRQKIENIKLKFKEIWIYTRSGKLKKEMID